VNTCPDVKSHPLCCLHDVQCCSHCPGCGIEGGEEPVSNGLHLSTPVTPQGRSDHGVMVISHLRPCAMTELCCLLRRSHYVGEENGGGDNIALDRLMTTGQELFDLVHESIDVANEREMILAR